MNRSKFTVDSFLFSTDPFLHLLGESFVKIDDGNGIYIATVLEVMNEGGTERKYLKKFHRNARDDGPLCCRVGGCCDSKWS